MRSIFFRPFFPPTTEFNGSTNYSGKTKLPMWINAETRKRLISASRDNILRIHEFPFTYSFAKVKCELFYAILYALISLKWLCWLISSPSCEMQLRKTKEEKKTSVAMMCNWSIWNKNLPIRNCYWNAKYHFIYWWLYTMSNDHDLKWWHSVTG